jgi:hypothetical protein
MPVANIVFAPMVVCGVTVMLVLLLLGSYLLYCVVVQTSYVVPFNVVMVAVAVLTGSPAKLATTLYVRLPPAGGVRYCAIEA